MIFNEIFSVYYSTVSCIITAALKGKLTDREIMEIIRENAFEESLLTIMPSLKNGRWQLLKKDNSTPLYHSPEIPLSNMEKRWLNAIAADRRIQLFGVEIPTFPDVPPLFTSEDYRIFDSYGDGDNYSDPLYISNFRTVLKAIQEQAPLKIHMISRSGEVMCKKVMPHHLEYSEKDDKFRLITTGGHYETVINMGRVLYCERYRGDFVIYPAQPQDKLRCAELEIQDERNALERVMLHFAHFEKQAEKTGENTYRMKVFYDKDDETEMVIRVLSFGPFVKATGPDRFTTLVIDRLKQQKAMGLHRQK
ncbi:MAG: WYL domain-containing protein [Oscillospiraceae bacterium]|nr:WYL domain-containing protein [Oscillospiraceae bacterium]